VIPSWSCNCGSPRTSHALQKNPIEQVKKNRFDFYRRASSEDCSLTTCRNRFAGWKNPIPGLKKKRSDFYTSPRDLFLNPCSDRSSQEKNFPNTDARRWREEIGIDAEIGASVTTKHLLLWRPLGEIVIALPIWIPNCDFRRTKCNARRPA
jgi:hypothetical protein